jgi:hypothetical protein
MHSAECVKTDLRRNDAGTRRRNSACDNATVQGGAPCPGQLQVPITIGAGRDGAARGASSAGPLFSTMAAAVIDRRQLEFHASRLQPIDSEPPAPESNVRLATVPGSARA